MNKLRNFLTTAAVLGALALIGSVMNSHTAIVQGAGGPTVTIDQAQLPLPVNGTVNVGGSVVISGTPTVNLNNSAGNPVFTRDVDSGRQPFQVTIEGYVFTPFTVPINKRFVIEYISYRQSASDGPIGVTTTTNGGQVEHEIPHDVAESYNGIRYSGREVRIYADPGTKIFVTPTVSTPGSISTTLSGHLVDVP
jgi:hypothetical protein